MFNWRNLSLINFSFYLWLVPNWTQIVGMCRWTWDVIVFLDSCCVLASLRRIYNFRSTQVGSCWAHRCTRTKGVERASCQNGSNTKTPSLVWSSGTRWTAGQQQNVANRRSTHPSCHYCVWQRRGCTLSSLASSLTSSGSVQKCHLGMNHLPRFVQDRDNSVAEFTLNWKRPNFG